METRKQIILYNLSEWLKGDIKEKVGVILVTRKLNFNEKLEKRVRSRLNERYITIFGPREADVVKKIIDKRL